MRSFLAVIVLLVMAGSARADADLTVGVTMPTMFDPNTTVCVGPNGILSNGACPVSSEDRSWHLLQRQYDGLIRTVTHGLTKHECDVSADRINSKFAAQFRCPDDTKEAWAKWHADHPAATSCSDDHGSVAWGSVSIQMTDIASAECFQ